MPRYVDLTSAVKAVGSVPSEMGFVNLSYVQKAIQNLPSADVQEVRHGRFVSKIVNKENWKGLNVSYYLPHSCSLCHTALAGTEKYCPNCGAKMDLKED